MTPSETTDEKRSRSYWGFVLVGAVVIVAAAFIFWLCTGGRQGLSLTAFGYGTNGWVTVSGPRFSGKMALVRAAVTNNTNGILVLGTSGNYAPPRLLVFQQTKVGWKRTEFASFHYEPGPLPLKLPPGQGFTFKALIQTDGPCRVGIDYLSDRLSSRICRKLPFWLTKKLSWASPWRTATTEVIDPSKPQ